MKLLANENFPKASVVRLRQSGFDIVSIGLDHPGITDQSVMELAITEKRMIITFDSDYGELIYKYGYKPDEGVLYLRLESFEPETPAEIVKSLLSRQDVQFYGRLTVYDGKTIRQRGYL